MYRKNIYWKKACFRFVVVCLFIGVSFTVNLQLKQQRCKGPVYNVNFVFTKMFVHMTPAAKSEWTLNVSVSWNKHRFGPDRTVGTDSSHPFSSTQRGKCSSGFFPVSYVHPAACFAKPWAINCASVSGCFCLQGIISQWRAAEGEGLMEGNASDSGRWRRSNPPDCRGLLSPCCHNKWIDSNRLYLLLNCGVWMQSNWIQVISAWVQVKSWVLK